MWALENQTFYTAESIWGRDKDGVHEWIVVVKGTYDIKRNGTLALADKQLEPLLVPEYHGEPGTSSLRYETDLVSPKPTTDVLINGTAYAPRGQLSNEFIVSARVGQIEKIIKVMGNRTWEKTMFGLNPSVMQPVTEVPIVYERAFGGYDQTNPDPKKQQMEARNPVGCGLVPQEGEALPNFEYPPRLLKRGGPAGFGTIASYWSPRRELQGTYDESWKNSRYPLVPADWDPRSLLCSPADQRPDSHFVGGEPVELINLTPDGKLSFALPKANLMFRTNMDGRIKEHGGRLVSVILEPDYLRVIMVWQTVLTVRSNIEYLEETVIQEVPNT